MAEVLILPPPSKGGALASLLAALPAIVAQLVQHGTPREIAEARHKSELLRSYAAKARLGKELQNTAAEARLRLERRLGELLAEQVSAGRPKNVQSEDNYKLDDIGVSRKLSSRSQEIAGIPERRFETYFRTARDAGWEITWGGSNGLQHRAASDHYELHRQRQSRAPEDLYYMPAGTGSDRDRPTPGAGKAYYHFDRSGRSGREFRQPSSTPRPAANNDSLIGDVDLRLGDCLAEMSSIADHSVDLILSDLPYGEQRVPWDQPLDLPAMWNEYKRIIKPNRPILLFGAEPFASRLVMSQIEMLKFDIVWLKNRAANFVHSNNQPLKFHERILVFSEGAIASASQSKRRMPYYPESLLTPTNDATLHRKRPSEKSDMCFADRPGHREFVREFSGYPRSVIECACETGFHPTQKPVPLLAYYIELFSRPGETVLDSCMGSGSTGVAAISTGRNFIGIEKHEPFFNTAKARLERRVGGG
jgi:site-specific DNA-methyltransferase (adenine-specific)